MKEQHIKETHLEPKLYCVVVGNASVWSWLQTSENGPLKWRDKYLVLSSDQKFKTKYVTPMSNARHGAKKKKVRSLHPLGCWTPPIFLTPFEKW